MEKPRQEWSRRRDPGKSRGWGRRGPQLYPLDRWEYLDPVDVVCWDVDAEEEEEESLVEVLLEHLGSNMAPETEPDGWAQSRSSELHCV